MKCIKFCLLALSLCLFTANTSLATSEREDCCNVFCDDETWAEGESPEERYQVCLDEAENNIQRENCAEDKKEDIKECREVCTAADDTDPTYDENDHYELACQNYPHDDCSSSYYGYGYGYGYGNSC
ncbi:hypothetical protein BVY02_01345 [bacterium J17]|nr:hypothetical protein BVY02_01345 [bacterium J17]